MENLSIEKFSPKKAELIQLADKYKALTINGVEDKAGYELVDTARKDLKKKRVEITKTGKELRDEAIQYQKAVIALEKELVAIIEPLEDELANKCLLIDTTKQKAERIKLLPDRISKLKEIGITVTDDELLAMNPEQFTTFYNEKNTICLADKERKIKEDEEKIKRAKEIEEEKKKAREEAEAKARLEAEKKEREAKEREDKIIKDAAEAKIKAVNEAEEKAEKDKQAIIDEQKRKDDARIAEEKRIKDEAEKKEKEAKEEQEKLEKKKKYQKWLVDNNYNPSEYYLENIDNVVIMYKFVSKFIND